ncbi:helix-turn-helix transcriptional regulator [Chitinophaga oryzae]|uniref:Helix-turn-helix transcriptional regulator n=1 Tax=Chitinophaga oryzae TaxID=2725414 RepID=A0AAE7D5H2_9BACT|nr:AraC family transcriptional regulator [Chitinophaga oryzae]QJB30059.1 helix-turn-helix transcriptional regulator [Chitinophaga oryzae]QJB36556.1 helix-turn-helix transcriptional regulator [Chitinophaga oryzae]
MRSKRQKKKQVPVHKADFGNGIEIKYTQIQPGTMAALEPHRDDYFVFFLQDNGEMELMIDFSLQRTKGKSIGYIAPGQVHHYTNKGTVSGWFLAVDIPLVQDAWRNIFEDAKGLLQCLPLDDIAPFSQCLQLVMQYDQYSNADALQRKVLHSLIDAYVGMVATAFLQANDDSRQQTDRAAIISRQFKELVKEHFLTLKSPAAYADKMNLSLSYLNEMVKGHTGFPVSHWIQQESLREAKRLLYYTDLTTKEIAFRTGFEDHTYFARVFRKLAGETPLTFRARYRDLSNLSL